MNQFWVVILYDHMGFSQNDGPFDSYEAARDYAAKHCPELGTTDVLLVGPPMKEI